jgi:DNA-binding HxlR family transcriptional regulator
MRSYGQYCPLAKAAEVLGDRWTVLIVRELIMGSHGFNDIERGLPRISRSLLSQRLQALTRVGIVERRVGPAPRATAYHLTPAGTELTPVIVALGEWGAHWAFEDRPQPDELDPILLLWWMRGGVDHDAIPPGRTVLRFDFTGADRNVYWLVLEPGDASVCLQDPGFETDLTVRADLAALYEVWAGRRDLARAMAEDLVRLQGPVALRRSFSSWFSLSRLSGAVRTATPEGATR